jgi:periplasmic protein TonB
MTPSTQVELPPERAVQDTSQVEPVQTAPRRPLLSVPVLAAASHNRIVEGSFQSSLIEMNRMNSGSKLLDILISLTMNVAILAAPILAGLYFTDTINLRQLESTFLVAPPPPPPPPPAPAMMAAKAPANHRVFEHAGKLLAPTAIPRNVAEIREAPLPADVGGSDGVLGGVPGGVAGGTMGGVIGGVIGGVNTRVAAPPAPAPKDIKSRAPVRLGGRVRAPRQIRRVEPAYPPLARQTHTQGTVVIEAVLDESGNVVEMKVVSGHGLLIPAALAAVAQWKYEPTYLNDQPVAVQMYINVTFALTQ